MSARMEELGYADTPIGEVTLRRRYDLVTKQDVFEVKLNDEWLMSSQFTAAEIALSRLGIARLAANTAADDTPGRTFDVAVGGLGLGYTAVAALEHNRVANCVVVELVEPLIGWHRDNLVPASAALTTDDRCVFQQGDFFAMSYGDGYDESAPGRLFDAVLLDIDHSPTHLLADGSEGFYGLNGMSAVASHLSPGGVYAMWSNDPPEDEYLSILEAVFTDVVAEVITFPNPLQGRDATATIYVATKRP
ncbi:spermidine synthase [Demequina aurantiaca]|uniref:spermidine synthase n=1 Tax=Demequina aurantiaca TaxID=676200 RepID=UPI003D331F9E